MVLPPFIAISRFYGETVSVFEMEFGTQAFPNHIPLVNLPEWGDG